MIQYNSSVVLSRLLNPLSANVKKWSNTLKLFVGKLQTARQPEMVEIIRDFQVGNQARLQGFRRF